MELLFLGFFIVGFIKGIIHMGKVHRGELPGVKQSDNMIDYFFKT